MLGNLKVNFHCARLHYLCHVYRWICMFVIATLKQVNSSIGQNPWQLLLLRHLKGFIYNSVAKLRYEKFHAQTTNSSTLNADYSIRFHSCIVQHNKGDGKRIIDRVYL